MGLHNLQGASGNSGRGLHRLQEALGNSARGLHSVQQASGNSAKGLHSVQQASGDSARGLGCKPNFVDHSSADLMFGASSAYSQANLSLILANPRILCSTLK